MYQYIYALIPTYICECIHVKMGTMDCGYSDMGWLRSVGSIKLYVSFAAYRLFYRSPLQQRPIILSILLTKATP